MSAAAFENWLRDMEGAPAGDGITLNPQQANAVEKIKEFLDDPSATTFGLYGYAGTGKTTTIHHALADYRGKVAMAAPTHKAVGVLSSMSVGEDTDFATIHRLLGCRSQWIEDRRVFRPDLSRDQDIHAYDVVVIDECSMIGEEMWGWVVSAIERAPGDLKIIVMGDPLQLPPVQDGESSPTFDLECARLTEIMRHEGVIEAAATAMREAVGGEGDLPLAADACDGHGEVINMGQGEFLEALLDDLESAKVLAYTNSAVNWINSYIREQLYGEDARPFEQGERLVLRTTYDNNDRGILHTGTELRIIEATRDEQLGLDCWRLDTRDGEGGRHDLYALDDEQAPFYRARVSQARDRGRASGKWRPFYDLKETFAEVRPGWATTIHKSQGSTYEHVYVIQTNVLSAAYERAVRAMLLYVAYSRARSRLIVS